MLQYSELVCTVVEHCTSQTQLLVECFYPLTAPVDHLGHAKNLQVRER